MKTLKVQKCACGTVEGDGFYRDGLCRSCYRFENERDCEIVRFYYDGRRPRRTGSGAITEKQAQEHCSKPSTRKEGVYFDGYQAVR